ncbi:hexose transporter Hxt13p [Trichomonascus vanleenenianus]|uniref:hexose transporter Hxt13p n=1 Tax=Trichomonascus vanleenenianus TaxID=2268995 RepID=UPI003ECA45DE
MDKSGNSPNTEKLAATRHVEENNDEDAENRSLPGDVQFEKTIANAQANLHNAIEANRPSLYGKGMIKLYAVCFLVYFCSTLNGFDGSLMGSINALPEYLDYYNMDQGSAGTGLVFSIFNIGGMTGSLFIWISDYRGRKLAMAIGCAGVIVGTIVTATAKTTSTFIGGRYLLSFFSAIATNVAPMYCVEIAPPHIRGTVSGFYNTLWYVGSLIAAFSIYGCMIHFEGSTLAFRVPLWLQMLCPGIVLLGLYFIPESPRWLVGKDRVEQARQFIIDYHCNGDADHPLVELELIEIIESLKSVALASPKSFFDIRDLFRTRSDRYRLMLIVMFAWFGQFSGNNVSSYYLPTMLNSVGITSARTQVLMNAIFALTGWIFASMGPVLHDRVGRRKMFLCASLGISVCLAIVAATTATFQKQEAQGIINHSVSSASIAFIFIFGAVFSISFTSMQPIYPGEVSSNKMRAKAMMVLGIVSGVASFVNQFAAPVAMAHIKYWFYVFFVFWDLIEFTLIYFFFVETKGRTLEELELVFQSENPVKASLKGYDEFSV